MDLVEKAYQWVEETDALLDAGLGPDTGFSLEHMYWEPKSDGAVELLNKGDPENLHVAVHATAERIIFSSNASSVATIAVKVPRPLSNGSLWLSLSKDARVNPNVSFNYFAHFADISHILALLWRKPCGKGGSFQVIGINALRIVDGSTFIFSLGTNPEATVMMLGWYVFNCTSSLAA
ncbi:unnamed protein product [Prunus armeniaca]